MKAALGLVDALLGVIIAALFGTALVLSLGGVAGRYISNRWSPDWIGEVAIFLAIWAILLGSARVLRRGAHIRVDFLFDRLSETGKRIADLMALALALILSGFLVWAGWQVVSEAMMWNERSISTLRVPLWIYYAALPVSFALQVLFILERAADILSGRAVTAPHDMAD